MRAGGVKMKGVYYISSALDIRNTVKSVVDELSDAVCEECAFSVRLVLNELLANSVLYANANKTVLKCETVKGELVCVISDDGEWYSCKEIRCSSANNIHGRGIYLAKCYSDYLIYDDNEHAVCFKIKLK